MKSRLYLVILLCLSLSPATYAECIDFFSDDFSQGIDTNNWLVIENSCGTVSAANETAEIFKPAGKACYTYLRLNQNQKFDLCGDFDIQVSFDSPEWPPTAPSGCRNHALVIRNSATGQALALLERLSQRSASCPPYDESYRARTLSADCEDSIFVDTDDKFGKLRLEREGNIVRAYYFNTDQNRWEPFMTRSIARVPVYVDLISGTCGSVTSEHRASWDDVLIRTPSNCTDADGDGFGIDGNASCPTPNVADCDDANPFISPAALEIADGIDNNCNDAIDEGTDDDGDGVPNYADACNEVIANQSAGVGPDGCPVMCTIVADADMDGFDHSIDCDDLNAEVFPGAPESCNQIDDNCNGVVDEGFDPTGDLFACNGVDAICEKYKNHYWNWRYLQCLSAACDWLVWQGNANRWECRKAIHEAVWSRNRRWR